MAPIVTKAQATIAVGWLLIGLYWIYQGITTGPSVLKLLVGLVCCLIGAANGSAVLQKSTHLQLPPLPATPAWARLPRRTPTPERSGAKKRGPGEESSLPARANTAAPDTAPFPQLEQDSITPVRPFAQADSPVPGLQWVAAPQIRSAPQGQPARPITSTQHGGSVEAAEPAPWAAVTPAAPWRLPRPIDPAPIPQWAPGPVDPNSGGQAPEPDEGQPAPVQPLRRPRSGRRSAT